MNGYPITEKLTILNIAIGKKMFDFSKHHEIKNPPSPLQFKILKFLMENKDKNVCQKNLEENLNVSKATISGALRTMEKNKIIVRSTSGIDAREKNIKLTDLSINRFQEMHKINERVNEALIQDISKEELDIFLSVMEKMRKNIEKIEVKKGNDSVI